MYVCLDCGCLFENPKSYIETHNLDCPPYETWSGCPNCGGSYIETVRCSQCDEYITDDCIRLENGDFVCSECFTKINLCEIGHL